jgi:hypothetical protein
MMEFSRVMVDLGGLSAFSGLIYKSNECEIVQDGLAMVTRIFPKFVKN